MWNAPLQAEDEQRTSAADRDPLHTLYGESHWIRANVGAGIEIPERATGLRIEGEEGAFSGRTKNEAAGSCHHAGEGGRLQWKFPELLTAHDIECQHRA